MTNEGQSKERQLTPREIARKSLESKFLQGIAGANIVRSNPFQYGELGMHGGESTYEASMTSPEVQKMREEAYKAAKKEGQQLGVFGEPSYPTNYELSKKVMRELAEYRQSVTLSDLGEIVKQLAPDFKFEIPAELGAYVPNELIAKSHFFDKKEMGEPEKDALQTYQLLSTAYERAIALRVAQSGYFADLNQAGKQISDKYKKPEEKK